MESDDGLELMEVFNMIYLGHDKIKPQDQNGTIKIISQIGVQYLYNVPVQDTDLCKPSLYHMNDIVPTVKGPTSFSEYLCIEFNLFSGAYRGSLMVDWDDEELCDSQGVVSCEKRIQSTDSSGEISVLFGFFSNATVANLGVTLLNQSAATNVYGVVVASNSKLDKPKCTSVLFVKQANDTIEVGPGGVIPLSKSRVAVPLDSVLYVDIALQVDGQSYKATVPLNVKNAGNFDAYDSEKKFRVTVKWDANEESLRAE